MVTDARKGQMSIAVAGPELPGLVREIVSLFETITGSIYSPVRNP